MNRAYNFFILSATFVVAIILMLIPLPDWARPGRPEWLILTLIYWSMALPKDVSVGIAWILGLCADVIQGALLGQHALGFVITAYITVRLHQQIRNHSLYQQTILVGIILLPYMSIPLWISGISGENINSWLYWLPAITSALIWPWMYLTLRAARRTVLTTNR